MMENKLSVIIPAYNVKNYIVACVDSLLKQIAHPNEIIIINDSSTDGTLALIEEKYGFSDTVKIVTIPNGGAGNARDHGISLARGDFIFCCDPDDIVLPGLHAEFTEVLALHPEIELFCFNSRTFIDGAPDKKADKVRHDNVGLVPSRLILAGLLRNGSYTSASWNYILKKSVIDKYKMTYRDRLHEDHRFTLEAYLRTGLAWASQNIYYLQRVREGSLTNSVKQDNYFRHRYDAFLDSWDILSNFPGKDPAMNELRRLYLIHSFKLMIYLSQSNGTPVPIYVKQAIRYLGRDLKAGTWVNWILLRSPQTYATLLDWKRKWRST